MAAAAARALVCPFPGQAPSTVTITIFSFIDGLPQCGKTDERWGGRRFSSRPLVLFDGIEVSCRKGGCDQNGISSLPPSGVSAAGSSGEDEAALGLRRIRTLLVLT